MLQALLFTAISVLVSCVGLFLFQKFIAAEKIERNNESTGIYFGVITILYSLILAFSITSVWDDYEEINANVAREAQKLADIYSYSNQLQASAKVELKTAVRNYTIAVIDDIEKGNTKARAQIAHESFGKQALSVSNYSGNSCEQQLLEPSAPQAAAIQSRWQ